ncbi:hypothetical protein T492DRAFT_238116 [Pavlovales sp. CCMP2436]|nr:hypothetical protein T492DRAFT_238116 [Pavlovales sp. CCMP2436]
MALGAPSNTLPAYAAKFQQEPGRNYGRTPAFGPGEVGRAYILPKPKFVNGRLTEPDVVEVAVPRGAAAESWRQHEVPIGVLTPLERREALAFEKSHTRARLAHRAEKGEHVRRAQLARTAYPRGMAGVEAPGTQGTQVYASESAQLYNESLAKASRAAARAEYLNVKGNSVVGYPLLEHVHHDTGERERMFQSRARAPHSGDTWGGRGEGYIYSPSAGAVQVRQPANNQERMLVPHDPVRAQAMWNAKEGGRNWDIISGVDKSIRCTVPERFGPMHRTHESHFAAAEAAQTKWGGGLGRFGPIG